MAREVGKVGKMSPEIGVKKEKLLTGGVPLGKKNGSIVLSTHWDTIDGILRHGALKPPNELKSPNFDLI
jgi:hypothetical protein